MTAATNATNGKKALLEVRGLRTWFPIRRGVFSRTVGHVKAVDGVSFVLREGETLGLVGESGCGKTTLGRTVIGLEASKEGRMLFREQDITGLTGGRWKALRRDMQMIFQDPYASLNPRMTVRDILTEGLAQHGLLTASRDEAARRLLDEVGLSDDSLYRYPFEFSGGQRQRVCIARAMSLRPALVVCDEAVSALDVSVQAQVLNLLMDLRERHELAYLFISHDLGVVKHLSDRVAVMYLGRIVEVGPVEAVMERARHPYTQALLAAVPVPGGARGPRIVLGGDVPSPANPPPGCPFHTRCPRVMDVCRSVDAPPCDTDGRQVRCHLYGAHPAEPGRAAPAGGGEPAAGGEARGAGTA